jgi:hypothetical protein
MKKAPTIDIEGVTHRLEGVKAHAVRQDDSEGMQRGMQAKPSKKVSRTVDEEIEILEKPKDAEVHPQTYQQPNFSTDF